MGWCSGTYIFDAVVEDIINDEPKEQIIESLILALEQGDWDCQYDSAYIEHSLVRKVMEKLHPDFYEDE